MRFLQYRHCSAASTLVAHTEHFLRLQSVEDIEVLVVDDDMPELERFALLFERGVPVQRLSVMRNLAMLAADHGERT